MKYLTTVRVGRARRTSECVSRYHFRRGDECVLRTERGVEWADVVDDSRLVPAHLVDGDMERILRPVEPDDAKEHHRIETDEQPTELDYCRKKIKEHGLPMKLVAAEHLHGGNKVIFYFLAEGRVDFRGLVRDLARVYRTRIELRQIGVRDEAKLVGDMADCGRELCCTTHLVELGAVSMRMAKSQKATLDPAKISGMCGRLKCCLRYEDHLYRDMKKSLPHKGTKVITGQGKGEVLGTELLAQRVLVELARGDRVFLPVDDIWWDGKSFPAVGCAACGTGNCADGDCGGGCAPEPSFD